MATNTNTTTRNESTRTTSRIESLEQAFVHELSDVLGAERQLLQACPELTGWATHDQLRSALEQHRKQSEEQVKRIEQVFQSLEQRTQPRNCPAMEGIIREVREVCGQAANPDVRDAFLIGGMQKIEHYQIATYGTLATWAERLGFEDAARLLKKTLEEDKQADLKFTKIAESSVNADARR